MTNISKKQVSLTVLAVVFTTTMVVGMFATSVFATSNDEQNDQSIAQACSQNQHSSLVTAGANSPVQNSGNQRADCTNTNNGGNAASD